MKYWARIENNVVADVIVADLSFVESLPGTWLETDPYTRGGVHYNEDGDPDGGVPLRKNFAGLGDSYDPVADAFYATNPPGPDAGWVFSQETYMWELPTD